VGAVLVVTGAFGGAFNVVFGSIRQRIVPNHLLGRVMASFRVISWGSLPLGALLGGIVGQTLGLPAVFIGAAAIHTLLLPSRLILTDAFMDEAEKQALANEAEASAA
jgi:predicted MFS family arabinose efflux permease